MLGFCGGLDPELEPGDVVVADELRGAEDRSPATARAVAGCLERAGLRTRRGPLAVGRRRSSRGAERSALAAGGAIAVDMESAWLAPAAAGRPFAALRAVVDTPSRELLRARDSRFAELPRIVLFGARLRRCPDWIESLPPLLEETGLSGRTPEAERASRHAT